MSKTTALMIRTEGGDLARLNSIDAQFALFDKIKLARTMAETHRFISTGDEKRPYKLVKREAPIRIFETSDSYQAIGSLQQTHTDRVGLNKHRGKYGDENRLFDQDSASLKVGEVQAWSTI